jgi:two-component system NtrC family sensor kinase
MKYLSLLIFLLPLFVTAQTENEGTLDSQLVNSWVTLDSGWKYQAGDNFEWAAPEFNDTAWQGISGQFLKIPESDSLAEKNSIVWFRKRIKTDLSFDQQLVMSILQTGASEIYLDGKLLHKFGKVSANPSEIVYYNPLYQLHSFPIRKGTEQLLAIRYVNAPSRFPLYSLSPTGMRIRLTTLKFADHHGIIDSAVNRYYLVLGVSCILLILFLSIFLFFPSEKMNGFFALACLGGVAFNVFLLSAYSAYEGSFLIYFFLSISGIFSFLMIHICVYRIFNRKLGAIFKSIAVITFSSLLLVFLFDQEIVLSAIVILFLLDFFRVSLKALKTHKVEALIFLFFGCLYMIFVIGLLLATFDVESFSFIIKYQPYGFSIYAVGIAINLGYSFGIKNKVLSMQLAEVEQLTIEKQAILADQNVVLEQQVIERTSALNESLNNLKSTQAQLIQSEKMASLGELTAGIAHEIQNPLNFVNNFAEVSGELVDEMNEELEKGDVEEAKAIGKDLKENLSKINHHGRRADAIVKGMLEHSRTNEREKTLSDLNTLTDEFVRLSYHGLRARDKFFNADFRLELEPDLPKVNIVSSDMGRVILNLVNNAFYAVNEKAKSTPQLSRNIGTGSEGGEGFKPVVIVQSMTIKSPSGNLGVEISVKDNGSGIPEHIKEKIFQPFFTTKPTGSGTGLGLSLSYDIVKANGGELKVESVEGEGTEFVILLPLS